MKICGSKSLFTPKLQYSYIIVFADNAFVSIFVSSLVVLLRRICFSGGNYFRAKFYDQGVVFVGGSCPGGNCVGGNFPRGQLSSNEIVRGKLSRGQSSRGQLSGEGNHPGGNFPPEQLSGHRFPGCFCVNQLS